MTSDNLTRKLVLKYLSRDADDLSADEAALVTREEFTFVKMSREMGMLFTPMMRQMTSRDYTRYRAAALIDLAQTRIMQQQRDRNTKKPRRGRRR